MYQKLNTALGEMSVTRHFAMYHALFCVHFTAPSFLIIHIVIACCSHKFPAIQFDPKKQRCLFNQYGYMSANGIIIRDPVHCYRN